MKDFLDEHGQPRGRSNYHNERLTNRSVDELIGLCKGIQADGVVQVNEARFLAQWLETNRNITDIWPANILAERINHIFEDGVVDDQERKDLFDLLTEITGYKPGEELLDKGTGEVIDNLSRMSTLLPLDKPAPPVEFKERLFCLTGKFFYGPRKKCENEIISRMGRTQSSPTQKTDYLVIGVLGSTDWMHSTHGQKIEYAVKMKQQGRTIAILSEEYWATCL